MLTLPALAQQSPDTANVSTANAQTRDASNRDAPNRDALFGAVVREHLGSDSRLYNGDEYIRNGTPARGFPFFDADSLVTGTLYYDGIMYPGIAMEYDLVSDKLIIRDYSAKALIALVTPKVNHFSIGSHYFRYVAAENAGLPKAGFYEQLFARGPVAVLSRYEKKLRFPTNAQEQAHYDQDQSYFISVDGNYSRIGGEDDLLNALKDKKDALKKYIRENKIRFHRDMGPALVQTTSYYLQIRN